MFWAKFSTNGTDEGDTGLRKISLPFEPDFTTTQPRPDLFRMFSIESDRLEVVGTARDSEGRIGPGY